MWVINLHCSYCCPAFSLKSPFAPISALLSSDHSHCLISLSCDITHQKSLQDWTRCLRRAFTLASRSLGFYPIYIWLHKTKCALLLQCNILKMVKNMKINEIWQIIQQNRNALNKSDILRLFHLDMLNTWINWQNTNVNMEREKKRSVELWDLSFVK